MRDDLPRATIQALMGADRVLILGGEHAVSAQVQRRVRAPGLVERLGGAHRCETAALAAGEALRRMPEPTLSLVVTSGESFAGALAATALAARLDGLLVPMPAGGPAGVAKVNRLLTLAGRAWTRRGSWAAR